ncbi:MAG: bifunctional uroporphyrinogen-III synthetase/response regulator domain protein [Acidimicrobiaceae bacterium]|nr:bifunctional uroporphyrinogen-III synthetase/response regulator domain protein [Acidimicrobiaceae bacterium]
MLGEMGTQSTDRPLEGWRVGVTADRRADQQVEALCRRGADVVRGCTMHTVDLSDDPRLREVSRSLVDEPPDAVVLQTGMGLNMWLEAMDGTEVGADLRSTLQTTEVLARGPKAVSAARRADLEVAWSAPDELFSQIVDHVAATGGRRRIALQVDGTDEESLAAPLATSCGEVVVVPVYRWALPYDTRPAEALVSLICDGEVDAVTFTTRQAAVHLVDVAEAQGRRRDLVEALDGTRVVPVSVGPVCSEAMRALGITGVVEPERARLVAMLDALAEVARARSGL